MDSEQAEVCGRCAMSAVVDATTGDGVDGGRPSDPFEGERIEISEAELRKVSPGAWLGRVKHRLDELATKLTYGK